jgi:2,3,4,5-tetrahydropyridine-2-carboxylate N-succinyltransferase
VVEEISASDLQWIRTTLERAYAPAGEDGEVGAEDLSRALNRLKTALTQGVVRAAEPQGHEWSVNTWVKKGIVLASRNTGIEEPGESSIVAGAHVEEGAIVLLPCRVEVGAWIGAGSTIESHTLVGSCAQVGERVFLSAASQLGGVLEPVGGRPVIVEDDVYVGGGCGIYEGVVVRRRAILAAGVALSGTTPVYDVVKGDIIRPAQGRPIEIPEDAVVIPGARKLEGEWPEVHGLSLQTPVIVKYRDEGADAATALEEALGQD